MYFNPESLHGVKNTASKLSSICKTQTASLMHTGYKAVPLVGHHHRHNQDDNMSQCTFPNLNHFAGGTISNALGQEAELTIH